MFTDHVASCIPRLSHHPIFDRLQAIKGRPWNGAIGHGNMEI